MKKDAPSAAAAKPAKKKATAAAKSDAQPKKKARKVSLDEPAKRIATSNALTFFALPDSLPRVVLYSAVFNVGSCRTSIILPSGSVV